MDTKIQKSLRFLVAELQDAETDCVEVSGQIWVLYHNQR